MYYDDYNKANLVYLVQNTGAKKSCDTVPLSDSISDKESCFGCTIAAFKVSLVQTEPRCEQYDELPSNNSSSEWVWFKSRVLTK